jgi:hypothetical protein
MPWRYAAELRRDPTSTRPWLAISATALVASIPLGFTLGWIFVAAFAAGALGIASMGVGITGLNRGDRRRFWVATAVSYALSAAAIAFFFVALH